MKVAITTLFFWPVKPDSSPPNNLAKALIQNNHDVTVFTQNTEANGEKIKRPDKDQNNHIKIVRSDVKGTIGTFGKIWSPKLKESYDIVHCIGGYRHLFSFIAYLKRKKAKFIISPFYPMHPKKNPFLKFLVNFIDQTLGRYILKNSDLCLAETNLEKEWLRRMGAKKVEIIPNPIPKEMFKKNNTYF